MHVMIRVFFIPFVATAGSDYVTLTAAALGFSATSMVGDMRCLNVSIIDDSEQEGSEAFIVVLAFTTVDDNREIVRTSLVTIVDNDG